MHVLLFIIAFAVIFTSWWLYDRAASGDPRWVTDDPELGETLRADRVLREVV